MAEIILTMQSLGVEPCSGGGRKFRRGETMHAIQYGDETPAGWFCAACVNEWKRTSKEPTVCAEVAVDDPLVDFVPESPALTGNRERVYL